MKATLEIDDDLLERAEQLARERGVTAGKLVSDILRESLSPVVRAGFPLIPTRKDNFRPEMELVNRLRDDE